VIIQVCASGHLKRESNSLAPGLKLRRNQVALASHAVAIAPLAVKTSADVVTDSCSEGGMATQILIPS
jgi:hypothetical protein